MRFHEEARRSAYDAIVVGSGLGGLTTAGLLARAGRRVLVVERHDRPGGYAHAFRRRRYRFDSAVHMVGGCEEVAFPEGGWIHRVLSSLGVRDRLDFLPVDPCYAVELPGLALRAPSGLEPFVEAHVRQFPSEEKGIRQLVEHCLAIRAEAEWAVEHAPLGESRDLESFPTLARYRRATLQAVLDEHIGDPAARAALAALWPYLGLPPTRLSFLYFATMLMSYVADGSYYCRGSFQELADVMASAVEERGGEMLLRSIVRSIRVEDGRARGIVLENGQRVDAPLVVSNADVRQTVANLVGSEHFPARFLRRMEGTASVSAFLVYGATDLPIDPSETAHETFLYETLDHEAAFEGVESGEPRWVSITVPTLNDPSLAPEGEHLFVLTTLVAPHAHASWAAEKERLTNRLVEVAERGLPGLGSHLRFCEGATPRTMERYTRNTDGALYGWELSPRQVGTRRLDNQTPIEGLYLAGHWTRPGGGVAGVVRSGIRTAALALGVRESELLG